MDTTQKWNITIYVHKPKASESEHRPDRIASHTHRIKLSEIQKHERVRTRGQQREADEGMIKVELDFKSDEERYNVNTRDFILQLAELTINQPVAVMSTHRFKGGPRKERACTCLLLNYQPQCGRSKQEDEHIQKMLARNIEKAKGKVSLAQLEGLEQEGSALNNCEDGEIICSHCEGANGVWQSFCGHCGSSLAGDAAPGPMEFYFVLDCSGSMFCSHSLRIGKAKDALICFLQSLPTGSFFNICLYAHRHEFLFTERIAIEDSDDELRAQRRPKCVGKNVIDISDSSSDSSDSYEPEKTVEVAVAVEVNATNIARAIDMVKAVGYDKCRELGGGTNIYDPLRDILSKERKDGLQR